MASTYTTNSGIEKPGDGEQSGTWGDTVNTNMDIIDTLVSGFIQITAGSTSVTLTTTDGSVTAGMNRAIKYVDSGDLGGNCTVTIAPNDQEKLIFVENGLSASRSLIFSQGSGANFTLQAGKQAIIRSDGAGSGAAVSGVLANLEITTLEVTGAAAIDGAATLGSTLAVTGAVTGSSTIQGTTITATTAFVPDASDGAALGTTSLEFSDLYLADGAVISFGDDQDITLTHTADTGLTTNGTFQATTITATGNLVASGTVEPAGDTSTGDNAAIGYTSAEGLILTGQGSTSDITLKNDADETVFTVPTGSTNILFPDASDANTTTGRAQFGTGADAHLRHNGSNFYVYNGTGNTLAYSDTFQFFSVTGSETFAQFNHNSAVTLWYDNAKKFETTTNGVRLSDASSIDLSTPLLSGADHTCTGLTAQMLAGGAISAFDLVCVHTTTGEVVEADASAYATARVIGIAPAAISDTATGTILLQGFIRDDSWSWTTGSTLYLSETAGAMTHTPPSTDGAFVNVVGVALEPDVVYINPSMDVIERA